MHKFIFTLLISFPLLLVAQNVDTQINALEQKVETIEKEKEQLQLQINGLKLEKIQNDINRIGLPELQEKEVLINHSAISLVYSEKHEQARWVSHVITADIIDGKVKRTNNFRQDPKVLTGSSVEKDYFTKTLKPGSKTKYTYNGFGYDRGHLAPSADFKWSKIALSESFFYSNMSPQLPEFNRKKWADLERLLRKYINDHPETQLFVVTGPILHDSLPRIEQGINKVSIPQHYFKVVLDLVNQKAIGFIMPNKELTNSLGSYAVSINDVEKQVGINFFYQLEDEKEEEMEEQLNVGWWIAEKQTTDVASAYQPDLPYGVYNTVNAKEFMGANKKVSVTGTVVAGRKSKNGHLFINLDKNYPNQIFTVAIWKKNISNFDYNPLVKWEGKQITLKGKVSDFDGTPTMIIEKKNAVIIHKDGELIELEVE